MAQLGARVNGIHEVTGSTPVWSTNLSPISHGPVYRDLKPANHAGKRLVSRRAMRLCGQLV